MTEITHQPGSDRVLGRYVSIFGDWCRKCRTRYELELLHIDPVTSIEEAGPDEVMIVCSGCKEEINLRLKEKLGIDLGPFGRSRKYKAAHNAPAHRWAPSHPAAKLKVPVSYIGTDGLRKKPTQAKKRRKPSSSLLGTTKKIG